MMKKIFFALCMAVFYSSVASAQLLACNVFLQGNHVEIGISPGGAYGSSVRAPLSYHAHCNSCGGSTFAPCGGYSGAGTDFLGFVADPLFTGWDTALSSHFMGDYILPGTPFEGWEIQVAGARYQAFSAWGGFTLPLTGHNTSYTDSAAYKSSVWEGSLDSLAITQYTTIDTGDLYFVIRVAFTNLSALPVNEMYYLRTLEPNNDDKWPGGSYTTSSVIARQGPDTALVTSYGTTGRWTIIGLGTITDTNARCAIYDAWPLASGVDLSVLYTATGMGHCCPEGYGTGGDNATALVYHIAHLAPVDSAGANTDTITFFYAFGAGIDSAMSHGHHHGVGALPVSNVNASTIIHTYPNPASSFVNLTGVSEGDYITLYNLVGQPVRSVTAAGNIVATLPVNDLSSGYYLVEITDASGAVKSKTLIQIR